MDRTPSKAAVILAFIALLEGFFVVLGAWRAPSRYIAFLGFAPGRLGSPLGWLIGLVVVAIFAGHAITRLPSVKPNVFRASGLKLLALAVAVAAGILEEVVFRKLLMDWLARGGYGAAVQVFGSALAFGIAHGVWGAFGRSLRAAVGATVVTGILGAMLGVVYLASGRSLAPCITAHFLINALIEPGLVLAALRGEMGRTPKVQIGA